MKIARKLTKQLLPLCALGVGAVLWVAGCSTNTQAPEESAALSEAPPVAPEPAATPVPAAQTPQTGKQPGANLTTIAWESTFEMALQKARASRKPVMVDFFATWCGPCHFLADKVYVAAPVVQESSNWISVQVDVDKRTDLAQQFQVNSMPTIVFFDSMGKEISRQSGVPGEEQAAVSWLVDEMQTARKQAAGTSA